MANTEVSIRAGLSKDVTLNIRVTGMRRWKVRQWLAIKLIALAAWVLDCNVVVDIKTRREEHEGPHAIE